MEERGSRNLQTDVPNTESFTITCHPARAGIVGLRSGCVEFVMVPITLEEAVDRYAESLLLFDAMFGTRTFMDVLRQVRARQVGLRNIELGTDRNSASVVWTPDADAYGATVGGTILVMKAQLLTHMAPRQSQWEAFVEQCDALETQLMEQMYDLNATSNVDDSKGWLDSWIGKNRTLLQLPADTAREATIVLRRISAWMMENVCALYAVRALLPRAGCEPWINMALVSERFKLVSGNARQKFLARVLQAGEAENIFVSAYTPLEYKCNALLQARGVRIEP